MAEITKINSKNALLTFSREELAEHDLIRWLKSNTANFGRKYFLDEIPFERAAAKLYNEKYPSEQVKYGKSFHNNDGTVSVFLSVTDGMSKDYIKGQHPDKLTFSHQPKYKAGEPEATDSVVRREAAYKGEGEVYFKVAALDDVEGLTDNKIFSKLLKQAEANDFDMTFFSSIPTADNTELIEFSSGNIRMVVASNGKSAELYSTASEDILEDNPAETVDDAGIEDNGVVGDAAPEVTAEGSGYINQDADTKGLN
jgi:hypothetical protein